MEGNEVKTSKRNGRDVPTRSYNPVALHPTSDLTDGSTSSASSLASFSRYTLSASKSPPFTSVDAGAASAISTSPVARVPAVAASPAATIAAVEVEADEEGTVLVLFRTFLLSILSFSTSLSFRLTGSSFALSSSVARSSASNSSGNFTLRFTRKVCPSMAGKKDGKKTYHDLRLLSYVSSPCEPHHVYREIAR